MRNSHHQTTRIILPRSDDENETKSGASDRRSFEDLTIHETIECPVNPDTLPPDAVRVADESVIVQDIEIKPAYRPGRPRNIRFQRQVDYSADEQRYFRGPMSSGYDLGDFSANLRALILSLKYYGNMSEPKIREFLKNFDVQISAGSVSNILTKTADAFKQEFDDLFRAGLASTSYQQTDDTSARVDGQFWHTHILCNSFYAAYFTRPHKDRLTVLEVLQNTHDYRHQTSVPLVRTIVCDDAGQFKLLTENLALGWIHEGRHYEKTLVQTARKRGLSAYAPAYRQPGISATGSAAALNSPRSPSPSRPRSKHKPLRPLAVEKILAFGWAGC